LGFGVLDFGGFCVLGCRIWVLRFGLASWGGWILLVFGLSFEFGCLGLGFLDFGVCGCCVLGCRIWELRFGLESLGVWILLVFGLSFDFGC